MCVKFIKISRTKWRKSQQRRKPRASVAGTPRNDKLSVENDPYYNVPLSRDYNERLLSL